MARAIYGRGFTFAEYTVIMSYHFAAYCLAKWGTKQAWREELAALWQHATLNTDYTPKAPTPKPAVAKKKKPVGRFSNHASQVERVFALMQEHRVGDKATIGRLRRMRVRRPSLRALARMYLDRPASAIGERLVNKKTGTVTHRRTEKHFASLVTAKYPYTTEAAIEAYHAEQRRRDLVAVQEWRLFFARLRAMTDDELMTYVAGRCRSEMSELTRKGAVFDVHLYQTRLKCAKQHLDWRGLKMPAKPTRIRIARPGDAHLPEEVPAVKFRMPEADLPDLGQVVQP